MEHDAVAASLAELGNSHRLAVFRFLVKAGYRGAPVGDIQQALGIPASTLSHHLARMAKVGLIRQERRGRTLVCLPQYQHLEDLVEFLQEECCAGVSVEPAEVSLDHDA
ncbi:MAG TPA: metalloregulator ArsR/SmtB family transcription factor [Halomonas sp.]|nr:metalloregulator ArsR/SmtB family transcription factor [Halomonas sp.]